MLLWTQAYTSKVSSTVKVDFSMSADVQCVCMSRLVWLIYDRHRYSYHCSHPNLAHPHPHPYTLTCLNGPCLQLPLLLMIYWGRGGGVYLRLWWKCWQPCQTFATGIRFFSLCHPSLSCQHFSKRWRHPNNITKQFNQKQICISHLGFHHLTVVQATYIWFVTV